MLLTALLLSAKFIPGTADAEEPARKESADEFRKHFEEHQRGLDRRVDVAPKTSGGISSGLIIVFGHAIKPPYKITFENDRLLVNGIVVKPSPMQLKEQAHAHKTATASDVAAAQDVNALMKWTEDTYREKKGTIPDEELEKEISAHVTAQKIVKAAKWTSKDRLEVTVDTGQGPFNLGIALRKSAPASHSEEEIRARAKKAQDATVTALEGQLKRGECVFFTTDGAETGCGVRRDEKKVRMKVAEIMDDSKLSRDEKTSRLRELLGDDLDAALDVTANYRTDEWVEKAR